jgi:hypothetical protein
VEQRTERLESIATLIGQIARTKNPAIRRVLLDDLMEECEPSEEYAFVVRAYIKEILDTHDESLRRNASSL